MQVRHRDAGGRLCAVPPLSALRQLGEDACDVPLRPIRVLLARPATAPRDSRVRPLLYILSLFSCSPPFVYILYFSILHKIARSSYLPFYSHTATS